MSGTTIGLDGKIVARPRTTSSPIAFPPAPTSAGSRRTGARPLGRPRPAVRAWPELRRSGRYELTLALPKDKPPRKVELTLAGKSIRKFSFVPGQAMH